MNEAGEAVLSYGGRDAIMALSGSADGVLSPAVAVAPGSIDGFPISVSVVAIGPAGEGAVPLTLSKTAWVKLSARCLRRTRGRRCEAGKSSWKIRGEMGANRTPLPRGIQRRLKRGTRYRLVPAARDSRGRLSRPKTITFLR